jgi:hypothetical protein
MLLNLFIISIYLQYIQYIFCFNTKITSKRTDCEGGIRTRAPKQAIHSVEL